MKALVYEGPYKVAVEEIEKPRLQDNRDAILKVTSAAICGSDMHMYEGRTSVEPKKVLGHEIMGVIDQVGDGVKELKVGDRVVLPFNIACGMCENCLKGNTSACLVTNPEHASAAYGYAGMGPYDGGQAEYVRVPFADFNALKLPGTPFDEHEDDFVLLADIFPTGWHSLQLAQFQPGQIVVIYGAGPVGLLAAYSAKLQGAAQVFVVDCVPSRLKLVEKIGATPINFEEGSSVEQIKNAVQKNKAIQQSKLPDVGQKKLGIYHGVDAVGYEAKDEKDSTKDNPMQVVENLVELLDFTGHLGQIGVFTKPDPGAKDEAAKQGKFMFPLGQLWRKGLTLETGQAPVKRYNRQLRDMIIGGVAKPSFIVSHHISIDEAPQAYDKFDHKEDGYTKVIIRFNGGMR